MILSRLFVLAILAVAPSSAMAFTITFDSLSGFASTLGPRTEGPFTYDRVSGGGWFYQSNFGNPPSALHTGIDVLPVVGDTFDFHLLSGGLFFLDSFQFASSTPGSQSDTVSFIGVNNLLEGVLCAGITSNTTTFVDKSDCSDAPIDHLLIRISAIGSQNLYFDNINLSTVPEPASLFLLTIGFFGLMGWSRKSKG